MFDYKFSTEHGKVYGLVMMGQAIFTLMFIMANLKIFSFANSYSIGLLTIMFLSILSGYITWLVLHLADFGDLEHSFTRLGSSVHYYVFGYAVIGLFVFDYGVTKFYGKISFNDKTILYLNGTFLLKHKRSTWPRSKEVNPLVVLI